MSDLGDVQIAIGQPDMAGLVAARGPVRRPAAAAAALEPPLANTGGDDHLSRHAVDSGASQPTGVRHLTESDVPAVADLFQETFRTPSPRGSTSLNDYLNDILLRDPWNEPDLTSRVFVGEDGSIEGFVGALPARMSLGKRQLRGVVATSMMVREPSSRPFAGAQLLRSLLSGPQDFTFTDSASQLSLAMWKGSGARILAGRSANWIRFLKPAAGAVSMLARRNPSASRLRHLARAADGILRAVRLNPMAVPERTLRSTDIGVEEFYEVSGQLEGQFSLRPAWDAEAFQWRFAHASQHNTRGALKCRIVLDRRDRAVGAYLYRVAPDATAFVNHLVTRPDQTLAVLTAILNDAVEDGLVAVWGRISPDLMDPTLRLKSLVVRASHTLIHSRDPEILSAAKTDDLFVGGLCGERWIRLVDDTFV